MLHVYFLSVRFPSLSMCECRAVFNNKWLQTHTSCSYTYSSVTLRLLIYWPKSEEVTESNGSLLLGLWLRLTVTGMSLHWVWHYCTLLYQWYDAVTIWLQLSVHRVQLSGANVSPACMCSACHIWWGGTAAQYTQDWF